MSSPSIGWHHRCHVRSNKKPHEFTREYVGLASAKCSSCRGVGEVWQGRYAGNPCKCVLRRVFRICLRKYDECGYRVKSRPKFYSVSGGAASWGRRGEEYRADFVLVARRALDEKRRKLFDLHFLDRQDWRLCALKLGIDKGNFFHEVYRAQELAGAALLDTLPHHLFPLGDYFEHAGDREIANPKGDDGIVRGG